MLPDVADAADTRNRHALSAAPAPSAPKLLRRGRLGPCCDRGPAYFPTVAAAFGSAAAAPAATIAFMSLPLWYPGCSACQSATCCEICVWKGAGSCIATSSGRGEGR